MTRQIDLFAPGAPYVAGSETSREAAESIKPDIGRLEKLVLNAIRARGKHGATDDEIEQATQLSHQTTSARRRGLVIKRLVIADGEHRRPTRSGRNAQVWRAIGEE